MPPIREYFSLARSSGYRIFRNAQCTTCFMKPKNIMYLLLRKYLKAIFNVKIINILVQFSKSLILITHFQNVFCLILQRVPLIFSLSEITRKGFIQKIALDMSWVKIIILSIKRHYLGRRYYATFCSFIFQA